MVGGFGAGVAGGATVAIVIKAVDQFSRTLTKAQKQMAAVGTAMIAVGTAGVFGMNRAIQSASNLQESVNAVNVVFGKSAKEMLKLSETASTSFGLSERAFNEAAVQFSAFSDVIAGEGGDVVDVIKTITGRTADFASVMNIDLARAQTLIQAGLAGETEGLRRFGIDVSAATIKTFAFANGIGDGSRELTEQEKILARYGSILDQTDKFAGDFINTSDDLANSQRILAAKFEDAKGKLGEGLLPVMEDMVGILLSATNAFSDLDESTQSTIGIVIAVTSVVLLLAGALVIAAVSASVLGIALLPFALIILGIIAVITAAILIFKNWGAIAGWLGDQWTLLGRDMKNIFIGIGNVVLLVWNVIISTIERGVNIAISTINFLIRQINRIPGIDFGEIGKLELKRVELMKFDFGEPGQFKDNQQAPIQINIESVNGLDADMVSESMARELKKTIRL